VGRGQRNLEVLSPAHMVGINPVQDSAKAHDGWPTRRGPQCSTVSPVLSFSLSARGGQTERMDNLSACAFGPYDAIG